MCRLICCRLTRVDVEEGLMCAGSPGSTSTWRKDDLVPANPGWPGGRTDLVPAHPGGPRGRTDLVPAHSGQRGGRIDLMPADPGWCGGRTDLVPAHPGWHGERSAVIWVCCYCLVETSELVAHVLPDVKAKLNRMHGNPRMGSVAERGTDDHCCGVFFLKWVLYIFNCILLVRWVHWLSTVLIFDSSLSLLVAADSWQCFLADDFLFLALLIRYAVAWECYNGDTEAYGELGNLTIPTSKPLNWSSLNFVHLTMSHGYTVTPVDHPSSLPAATFMSHSWRHAYVWLALLQKCLSLECVTAHCTVLSKCIFLARDVW